MYAVCWGHVASRHPKKTKREGVVGAYLCFNFLISIEERSLDSAIYSENGESYNTQREESINHGNHWAGEHNIFFGFFVFRVDAG